ncbi:MAG: OprO/OprP family phosphate-selective porin [Rickettsiales bacterium]|jgi:phosphate-selective porin|nr:OprO/OprP family phosphate-selective porin [Rickettsiales bacterium]
MVELSANRERSVALSGKFRDRVLVLKKYRLSLGTWYRKLGIMMLGKRSLILIVLVVLYIPDGVAAGEQSGKSSFLDNIKFSGRVHYQISGNRNSGKAGKLLGVPETGDKHTNVGLPKFLLGVGYRIGGSNFLVTQFTSEGGEIVLDSLFFKSKVTDRFVLTIGRLPIPLSMEADTSGNHFLMNEKTRANVGSSSDKKISRKTVVLFTTMGIGANAEYSDEYAGLQMGFYGNDVRDRSEEMSKKIFSVRGRVNPYRKGNNLVHLGANYFYEDRGIYGVPAMTKQEADEIGTMPIFASDRVGFEFALNYGIVNFQSEYHFLTATVGKFHDSSFRGRTKKLHNFYAQVNINLTGETLEYSSGVFGSPRVKSPVDRGGPGAIGLVARYSENNLNDYSDDKPFDYGRHREISMALNWMPVNSLRFTMQLSNFREKFELPRAIELNEGKGTNEYYAFSLKSRFFF